MQDLTTWAFGDTAEVCTLTIDGEPWFVGKDVAAVLGYSNTNKAVQMHVDEVDIKALDYRGFSQNGVNLWEGNDYSNKILINEPGLYALIFASKLPTAKAFKRRVTSEVLPAIRKTGQYGRKPEDEVELLRAQAVCCLAEARKIEVEKGIRRSDILYIPPRGSGLIPPCYL